MYIQMVINLQVNCINRLDSVRFIEQEAFVCLLLCMNLDNTTKLLHNRIMLYKSLYYKKDCVDKVKHCQCFLLSSACVTAKIGSTPKNYFQYHV